MRRAYFWQFLLFITFTGCTVGPKYVPPEMDIPNEWHAPGSEGMSPVDLNDFVWWESLNDPVLNSLILRASQQNLDLFIAGTRILEARLGRKAQEAAMYPHIDGSVTTGHLTLSKDIQKHVLGACSSCHKHHCKRNFNFFEIGFDADWEIDLFGFNKHELNAAEARLESMEESLCDIWVTLSAEIARNYIELRGLQQRKQLILKNIASQEDSLKLINELLEIGTASSIDLLQAQEQFTLLVAEKPLIDLSIDKSIHRLSILLGYPPGELFAELCAPQQLPMLPCEKPIGLPSDLLRRRPDIRKAERNLAAATESVGSAVAALFPRFSLFGFVGEISTHLKSMTNSNGVTWFAAPQLLFPIFNSRLLTQDVQANKIQTRQTLFDYQKTVLSALEEVENAMASFRYESERNEHLHRAQLIDQEAYQLTLQLYQKGVKDYLSVLIANRTLLAIEESYLQSQVDLLLHYVSLYKALGGGWNFVDGCRSNERESCEEVPTNQNDIPFCP